MPKLIIANFIKHKEFRTTFFPSVFFLFFFFSQNCLAQPAYNIYLSNIEKIDSKTIEFEVCIKSTGDNFYLTSYQCSFLFGTDLVLSGKLSFTYIDQSSQLSNLPIFSVGINTLDGHPELTFASLVGLDVIIDVPFLMGRFRFKCTEDFANLDPNFSWDFNETVMTMLTDETFQNITVPSYHTIDLPLSAGSDIAPKANEYKLFQNFPNPFNPVTKISFNLPSEGNVKLTIYNVLGQEVKTLVNERLKAGFHSEDFSGEFFASGLYFCKLSVDDKYSEIVKMILLK